MKNVGLNIKIWVKLMNALSDKLLLLQFTYYSFIINIHLHDDRNIYNIFTNH